MIGWLAIAVCYAAMATSPDDGGIIEGMVVNGSQNLIPVPDATVVLRAEHQGAFISVAQTQTDKYGRFRFEQLPITDRLTYLPGANFRDIHYPGGRVNLGGQHPAANQTIVVYETVDEPSPLIASGHEIEVRSDHGVLVVTETIMVANRSNRSFVGSAGVNGGPPVTLRLSIPPEFEKVTFVKEFFGRQFQLNKESLETQIPWTPGKRELKFTYRLPIESQHWLFRRPLDLPTERIRFSVIGDHTSNVSCNLAQSQASSANQIVFESKGEVLPAGHIVALELGSLPVPWTTYARWGALAGLAFLLLGISAIMFRRRGSVKSGECARINKANQRRAA